MKCLFALLSCLVASIVLFSQSNVQQSLSVNGSGATADASAQLDVSATDKGMLVPRMTSPQRTAIASPATGLLVFDTNTNAFWFYNGTAWTEIARTYLAGTGINIVGNVVTNTGDTNPADDLTTASTAGGDVAGTFSNLQIAAGAVSSAEIADGTVTVADLAVGVIPTTLPPSGAAGGDLSGTYPNPDIAAGAVGTAELVANSVTDAKISSGAALNGRVLTANGAGGAAWTAPIVNIPNKIEDADGDTKIQVEESPDEDIIRFDLGGTEKMVLRQNAYGAARLELPDLCYNAFVGKEAGANNISGGGSGYENSFFGYQAGMANTSGSFNTFLGKQAGSNNLGGAGNTATGAYSLFSNTTGTLNTANGLATLYANTTGSGNTASGESALNANVAGSFGTAFGHYAMRFANSTTTPFTNYNVAVGFEALRGSGTPSANTGNSNIAIGFQTLLSNTTGSFNTAVGKEVLRNNTSGINNTASGFEALYTNTIAAGNTAYGSRALRNNYGFYNTASGLEALYSNMDGSFNTANGLIALYYNTSGEFNTACGWKALYSNTTGIHNTALGADADVTNGSLTNATAIGYNAKVGCSNCLVLGGTGSDAVSVGIGVTSVASGIKLQVEGNVKLPTGSSAYVGGVTDSGEDGLRLHHAGSSAYIDHKGSGDLNFRANNANGGTIRMTIKSNGNIGIGLDPATNKLEVNGDASKSSAGDWLANSDARLKKNIRPMNSDTMLAKMLSLQGITYEWNDDKTGSSRPEGIQYGFTAQNIREAFPTFVSADNLGYLQTAYGTYDAMTVEAIRALNDKITALEAENKEQKTLIALQKKQLEAQADSLQKITAALLNAGILLER